MDFLNLNKAEKIIHFEELKEIRNNRLKKNEKLESEEKHINSDTDSNLNNYNEEDINKKKRKRRRKLPKNKYIEEFASESDLSESDEEITEEFSEDLVQESEVSELMSMNLELSDYESETQVFTQDIEIVENHDRVTRSMVNNINEISMNSDSQTTISNDEWKTSEISTTMLTEHSYSQNSSVVCKIRKSITILSSSHSNSIEFEHCYSQTTCKEYNKDINTDNMELNTENLHNPFTLSMESNNISEITGESQYRVDVNSPELINLKDHIPNLHKEDDVVKSTTLPYELRNKDSHNIEVLETQEEVCSTSIDTDDQHSDPEEFNVSTNSCKLIQLQNNEELKKSEILNDIEGVPTIATNDLSSEPFDESSQNSNIPELNIQQRNEGFDIITKYFNSLDCLARFAHHKRNDFKYHNREIRNVKHLNKLSLNTLAFIDFMKDKMCEVRENLASNLSTYFENNNLKMSEELSKNINKNKDKYPKTNIDKTERNNVNDNNNKESTSFKDSVNVDDYACLVDDKEKNSSKDEVDKENNDDVHSNSDDSLSSKSEIIGNDNVVDSSKSNDVDDSDSKETLSKNEVTENDSIFDKTEKITTYDTDSKKSCTSEDAVIVNDNVADDQESRNDVDNITNSLPITECDLENDYTKLHLEIPIKNENDSDMEVEKDDNQLEAKIKPCSVEIEFNNDMNTLLRLNEGNDVDNELLRKRLLNNSSSDSDSDEEIKFEVCDKSSISTIKSNSNVSYKEVNKEDDRISIHSDISTVSVATSTSIDEVEKDIAIEDYKLKDNPFVKLIKTDLERMMRFLKDSQNISQELEIKRLTDLSNLKRVFQSHNHSSSESDEPIPKKRRKIFKPLLSDEETEMSELSSAEEFENKSSTEDIAQEELAPENHNDFIKNILCDDEDTESMGSSSVSHSSSETQIVTTHPNNPIKPHDKDTKGNENTDSDADSLSDSGESNNWRNDPLLTQKLTTDDKVDQSKKNKTTESKIDDKEEDSSAEEAKSAKTKTTSSASSNSESSSDMDKKTTIEYFFKKQKKLRKKRKLLLSPVVIDDSDSDSDISNDNEENDDIQAKGRRNIREVISDEQLEEKTKQAKKEEDERIKRLTQKYSIMSQLSSQQYSLSDEVDENSLVLDLDPVTKKNLVIVHPLLSAKLKEHQREGVRFMWDNCYESLEKVKNDSHGKHRGCILAHCMGLGKTLQVIALVHTLISHKECKTKKVLVVCPLSTVLNWEEEIRRWLKPVEKKYKIPVFVIPKQRSERRIVLSSWVNGGGILLISYTKFRVIINTAEEQQNCETLQALLDPGPDLLICDEGHKIKNASTGVSKALSKILTKRRILLTGTPMQNHLQEYYCMVHFVKPHLLGNLKEFKNRFANPIANGLYKDSSKQDIMCMKHRSHVLHKILKGTVQRKEQSILKPYLPPKYEYVVFLGMSALQETMYKYYLTNYAQKLDECYGENNDKKKKIGVNLLSDHARMKMIWTHPNAVVKQLNYYIKEKQKKNRKKTRKLKQNKFDDDDFEGNQSEADDEPSLAWNGVAAKHVSPADWWKSIVSESELKKFDSSSKAIILLDILSQCQKTEEKVLVFSTAINVLNTLEDMLKDISNDSDNGTWIKGKDYFRLDGSVESRQRFADCATFNDPDNLRARLYLVSTKAGGLGINMIGASRVVILDTSWNPADEQQSIFRAYRLGQKKTVYVYRLLSQGTMEEKIYNRSVTKQAVSCRVVDEQQIDRHFSMEEYRNLYIFEPPTVRHAIQKPPPADPILCNLINNHSFLYDFHEHDSLLQNIEAEELNAIECAKAWDDFLLLKTPRPTPLFRNPLEENADHNEHINHEDYLDTEVREANSNMMYRPAFSLPSTSTAVTGVNGSYTKISKVTSANEFQKSLQNRFSSLNGQLNDKNMKIAPVAVIAPLANIKQAPSLSEKYIQPRPSISMTQIVKAINSKMPVERTSNFTTPGVIKLENSNLMVNKSKSENSVYFNKSRLKRVMTPQGIIDLTISPKKYKGNTINNVSDEDDDVIRLE